MNVGSYSCCKSSKLGTERTSCLSSILQIISEESRLKILCILLNGEHCVCEIMEHIKLSQSLISHHLKDLKEAGILIDEKRGLRVYYSLTQKGNRITNLLFSIPKMEVSKL